MAKKNKKVYESTLEAPLNKEDRKLTGRRKCCHAILFLFIFLNDVADFVSDWLFFSDVAIAEKGLVYGPPDSAAKWCLLFFSIVGTITFIVECINLFLEVFKGSEWLDSDYLSAVVIWVEDIPQVAISLYLALCREEPISIFQLTKAAVILIGVVIRIIMTSVKYCRKEAIREKHHVKTKVVIMLGVILEAACAVAIFFLTQTEKSTGGHVSFRVPTTVIEETYNDQRYFANVSVFLHDSQLFDVGQLDTNKGDDVVNWLRLTSLNKIRWQDNGQASFRLDYEKDSTGILKLAVLEKLGQTTAWSWTECYEIDPNAPKITEQTNATCAAPGYFSNPTKLFISFSFKKPGAIFKRQVFGDVLFNVRQQPPGGKCEDVSNFTHSAQDSVDNNIPITFHYYRTNATLSPADTRHLRHDTNASAVYFFSNDQSDLQDVQDIWRTGWLECASTGNVSPTLDRGIAIDCK